MADVRTGGRAAAVVLGTAICLLATAAVFVLVHLALPGDGTSIRFDATPAAGLMVTVWRSGPGGLAANDIVLEMDGRPVSDWLSASWRSPIAPGSGAHTDLVLRGGRTELINQPLGPYDFGRALGDRWTLELSMVYLLGASAVVFRLRPGVPSARALFLVSSAITASTTVYVLGLQVSDVGQGLLVALWLWGSVGLFGVAMAGLLHFCLVFPYRHWLVVRWPWLQPVIYVGIWVPYLWRVAVGWAQAGNAAGQLTLLIRATEVITLVAFSLVFLASLIRFGEARSESQRRQSRWFVWGLFVAGGPWLALTVIPNMLGFPALIAPTVAGVFWCAVPTALGIAIVRERLFDIDVIIRRTLVYSLLSVALALVYFASVVLLQNLFEALNAERSSALVTVLSTLAIAALFGPIRQRVQTVIDRQFYRRKYDAARLLSAFGARLRDDASADLGHLSGELLAAVDESMQPQHATLWLRAQPTAGGETAPALHHSLMET